MPTSPDVGEGIANMNQSIKEWSPQAEGKESDLLEGHRERGLDPGVAVAFETCCSAYSWILDILQLPKTQDLRSNYGRVNSKTATDQVDD